MTIKSRTGQAQAVMVAILFGIVLILQIADLHSTLINQAGRAETNPAIDWLASRVGLAAAVAITKGIVILALAFSFQTWRKTRGGFDLMFAVGLIVTGGAYAAVVFNNYSPWMR